MPIGDKVKYSDGTYTIVGYRVSKKVANKMADNIRGDGYRAKVVKRKPYKHTFYMILKGRRKK